MSVLAPGECSESRGHGSGRGRASLACAFACLFFGYAFLLRVSPSVMVDDLMRDLAVGAALLGHLSAFYLYIYAILQVPIGLMMDRMGPRRLVSTAACLVGVGTLVFANADTVDEAYTGRLLIGAGCAFSWPALLAIINQWFPWRFALLAGLGQVTGMVGAVFGQAPLSIAVQAYGWRHAMLGLSVIGIVLGALLWWCTRDRQHPQSRGVGLSRSLRHVVGNTQTLVSALFGFAMAGQILAFGGLWGVPFLGTAYGLEPTAAAGIVSLLFVGSGVGGLTLGWLSDHIGRRKPVMLGGGLLCTTAQLVIIYVQGLPVTALSMLVFLQGFGGAAILLAFATAREHNAPNYAGLAIGVVNTAVIASGAVFQPVVGVLLDTLWSGGLRAGARVYSGEAYEVALSVLVVGSAVGTAGLVLLRETFCRRRET